MKARSRSFWLVVSVVLGIGAAIWWRMATSRREPSAAWAAGFAERLAIPGVPNLGLVSGRLYRGGQPSDEGLAQLAGLCVKTIVNLRDEPSLVERERKVVEALGMRYVSIPLDGVTMPSHDKVAAFLALLQREPGETIFVHCRRGAERTGVMIAAVRIAFSGWAPERALAEMNAFSFRGLLYPHLARYVRMLPRALRESSAFSGVSCTSKPVPSPAATERKARVPEHP